MAGHIPFTGRKQISVTCRNGLGVGVLFEGGVNEHFKMRPDLSHRGF